ncbi:hypothetical protein SVIOM74S_05339 [Streptomyces violarus]
MVADPASFSAANRFRAERVKKSSAGSVSKDGELDTSHDHVSALECFGQSLAGEGVDPRGGSGGHGVVPLVAQQRDHLRADESGTADDHDLHHCLRFTEGLTHQRDRAGPGSVTATQACEPSSPREAGVTCSCNPPPERCSQS